ncbi:hypothetical protein A2U01_0095424, partial [Trifolium medium]|nr:hypothetical protein [Trifolium medium]
HGIGWYRWLWRWFCGWVSFPLVVLFGSARKVMEEFRLSGVDSGDGLGVLPVDWCVVCGKGGVVRLLA